MCPFNQYRPDSDEVVVVTFIKSEPFLAQNRVPFWHAFSPAERRPRLSQILPLSEGLSSQRLHLLCINLGPQIQRPPVGKNNFSGNQQMFA